MSTQKQPYIYSPNKDLLLICLPSFFCIIFILFFHNYFDTVSNWWWLLLIVGIDVTHVYTTLYKTYYNPNSKKLHHKKLLIIPFVCFILAFLVYVLDVSIFWSLLAYIAVFHFIRQQYGFVRLYSRYQNNKLEKQIDTIMIYASTIYPIIYWHIYGPFEFSWFTKNDFLFINKPYIENIGFALYAFITLFWVCKELYNFFYLKTINIPKTLIIIGTSLSWYIGIVFYNNDLTFSLLNIVSHGIPYIALIWFDQIKEIKKASYTLTSLQNRLFRKKNIILFIAIPLFFAFAEENLWNLIEWREHRPYFFSFNINMPNELKQILIPLLVLPQLTHYVIDGFIWKVSKGHIST
jgi:hypothetical protein